MSGKRTTGLLFVVVLLTVYTVVGVVAAMTISVEAAAQPTEDERQWADERHEASAYDCTDRRMPPDDRYYEERERRTDSGHEDRYAYDCDRSGERDQRIHLHVQLSEDGDSLLVTVAYQGPGSAVVSVEAVNGTYAGSGTYEIDGRETFELPVPEQAIRITAKADSVERSVVLVPRPVPCDPAMIEEQISDSSDVRRIIVPVPNESCAPDYPQTPSRHDGERAMSGDWNESQKDAEKTATPDRYDRHENHGSDEEPVDDAHGTAHETYEDGHDRALGLYERLHTTAIEAYQTVHSQVWGAYEALTSGGDGGDQDPVEHVENDTRAIQGDVEDDANRVQNDVENDTDLVRNDTEDGAERICGDFTPGACEALPEPGEPSPPGTPDSPVDPTVPETPDGVDTPTPPGTPAEPELPDDGGDDGTPSVPELPDDGGDGETSVNAGANAEITRDGSDVHAEAEASAEASHDGTSVKASRSGEAGTSGSVNGQAGVLEELLAVLLSSLE